MRRKIKLPNLKNMIANYLKQQQEFAEKYSEKTVVLIQVGSFYELYEYNPEKTDENLAWPDKRIGQVKEISELLNMVITRKDKKKPYALNNCDMVGFPVVSYEKHRDVLLHNNYTIVRIDQRKNAKDELERYTAEILSPSTNLENISSIPVSNNIVSIYIEILKKTFMKEDYTVVVGLSCIDVTTGQNTVLEIYSQDKNAIVAIQEIYRYLSIIRPREVLVNLINGDLQYQEFLCQMLELGQTTTLVFKHGVTPDFLKVEYQTKFLSKTFNIGKTVIEDLGLERISYGCISYLVLLQYCYEHNSHCIEKLNKPNTSWLEVEKYLILMHNSIGQLNLLPSEKSAIKMRHNRLNKNIDSLFSVVNYTKTSLGKRYLMNMLTCPSTSVKDLNISYDMIEFMTCNRNVLKELSNKLKEIPDIERYQRKLYLKIIKPHELSILFSAYIKIVDIYTTIYNTKEGSKIFSLLFDSTEFSECLSKVLSKFKLDVLSKSRIDNGKLVYTNEKIEKGVDDEEEEEDDDTEDLHLLYPGFDPQFDRYCSEIKSTRAKLDRIVANLNTHLEKTKGKKIVYNPDSKKNRNLSLWTTVHKAEVLKKTDLRLTYIHVNKEVMVTSDVIAQTCKKFADLQLDMAKYLYATYMVTISEVSKYTFFNTLTTFISKVDYICSGATCAIENKYFRPKIEGKESFFDFQNMRHPIVECLIPDSYICNDVTLEKTKGILLYGQNSSGKSTFGKAIALNIILAQAGLYTAGNLRFYPYNRIITRLSGGDSVLEGLSSFVIEMKELRTILRNADASSLVIADEIARGTESVSAISLTVSSVTYLLEKNVSFIFSTHLHALTEMKDIVDAKEKLRICHLALRYDNERNVLVYDRKLKDGPGDSVYGLEVAQSLNLDPAFVSHAYAVRKEIVREATLLMSNKKSKYNSKVYLDACIICGCTDVKKLQTHHIEEQHKSDEAGFIGFSHKNIPGNLIEICDVCHESLHSQKLALTKQVTSAGVSLTVI